jgi:hypothetical protein
MTTTFAPPKVPFAPRPISDELFSSWLLRVAAANCVTLQEFLDGFYSVYPEVPLPRSLDFNLPPVFLTSLSAFCRVSAEGIETLDLAQRFRHLDRALLLKASDKAWHNPRVGGLRVGYAFCPRCIGEQKVPHLNWSWCFACIVRCPVHRTTLILGCPYCGEDDPVDFAPSPLNPGRHCWACGTGLYQSAKNLAADCKDDEVIRVIEDTYRAALLDMAPDISLLGKVTGRAFRRFIDDMLDLLTRFHGAELIAADQFSSNSGTISRHQLLDVVKDLISSAATRPAIKLQGRTFKYSLRLWASLISAIPEREGKSLALHALSKRYALSAI